jgi:hypothetical protein
MVPARRFFAAVSWQGAQATSQAQQKVVPVSGDFMGGEWAEAMARKEMAEFIPYKLYWGCSRWAGRGETPGDSPKFTFSVSSRRDKGRKPGPSTSKTALWSGLHDTARNGGAKSLSR